MLAHAGVADSRQWDPQWDDFKQRHRVLRYDARGFGRSTLPGGEFSNAGDLEALLDAAGMERAALVGASFGSRIVLEVALRAPDRVSALVIAPPGLFGRRSDVVARFSAAEDAAFERGDVDAAVELNLDLWAVGPSRARSAVDPDVLEAVRTMQRRAFELQLAAEGRVPPPGPERREERLAERFHEISVPALILVGDADVGDVHESARLLEERLPRARLETVAGAAHVLNMERPAQFTSLVLDFLAANHEEA